MENKATPVSDHNYRTVSSHRTSEGMISYRRCSCDLWQIVRGSAFATVLEAEVDGRVAPLSTSAFSSTIAHNPLLMPALWDAG